MGRDGCGKGERKKERTRGCYKDPADDTDKDLANVDPDYGRSSLTKNTCRKGEKSQKLKEQAAVIMS